MFRHNDSQMLAELPAGARHAMPLTRDLARSRLDVALPMAQFYISRARATGDLRFLGYAEAILAPWLERSAGCPCRCWCCTRRCCKAGTSSRRHSPNWIVRSRLILSNAQAWLTRATVLRVLGRYDEALRFLRAPGVRRPIPPSLALCVESIRSLSGHLRSAYAASVALPPQGTAARGAAWRYSELGEMAVRLGDDAAAERWLRDGLQLAPDDFYLRAAYADLLLRQRRAAEVLELLKGHESMEPMLLRIAIAQRLQGDALRHAGAGAAGQCLRGGAGAR